MEQISQLNHMKKLSKLSADILVVGAGPGGSTAAFGLSKAGYDVLLVDKASFPRDKTCGDAISPLAVQHLANMGILPDIINAGARVIRSASISGTRGIKVQAEFHSFLNSDNPHGLAMPRYEFDQLLLSAAVKMGTRFQPGITVRDISRQGDEIIKIEAASKDASIEIQAKYYIIAVGANIGLLRNNGFLDAKIALAKATRGYYQIEPHPSLGYDFFYKKELFPGYGWVFPVKEDQVNIGVGTGGKKNLPSQALPDFVEYLSCQNIIVNPRLIGQIKSYPLRIDFPSQQISGENWLLVGESAGLVNPLTGEGIDLAIESGTIAAQEVINRFGQAGMAEMYRSRVTSRFDNMFASMNLIRKTMINSITFEPILKLMDNNQQLLHTFLEVTMGLKPGKELLKSKILFGWPR